MPTPTAGPAAMHALWHSPILARARHDLGARDGEIVDSQIAVSQIAAPTGDEHVRGAWMAERFRTLGLHDVRTDSAGNVIGRRPGSDDRAPVVICAHLDTVFPHGVALRMQRAGSRIAGPGIGDNGRGLAVMLALATAIDGHTLRTRAPIDFVATTGEEGTGDLRGAKELFATATDTHAAIALDGAGDERIVHRALGSRRYRIAYRGVGGHSWTAYGVANPVHAAAIAAAKLARLPLPSPSASESRTTLSVGRIGGGMSVNSIPDSGWLEVDLRSISAALLVRYDREIHAIAAAAEQEENGRRARGTTPLACTVSLIGDRPSGETPADHPLVTMAVDATRLIGRSPELATASTDANVPISRGVPAIAIGAGGRGGDAHTPGEWFDNVDGPLGVARALAIIVGAATLDH